MEKDGKKYTRVSTIIQYFKKMEPKFNQIPLFILEKKGKLGTEVHKAIEANFKDEFYPLDEKASGYYESFEKWKEDKLKKKFEFLKSEQRFFDEKNKITGCIDLLIIQPGKTLPSIVDFKTSVEEDKIYWPLQGSFYFDLTECACEEEIFFVKLDKKGDFPEEFSYKYNSLVKALKEVYFYLTKENIYDKIDS